MDRTSLSISVRKLQLQHSPDMYNNNTDLSLFGGLASGVPGELRGMEYLHKHYGKLPWAHVMKPAINVARNGFTVTQDLVDYEKEAIEGGSNFLVEDRMRHCLV